MARDRSWRSERGQILGILLVWVTVILLMLALVVNGGILFVKKREAQRAADAAALAAASALPGDCSNPADPVRMTAEEYAITRNATAGAQTCTTPYNSNPKKIKVVVTIPVSMFLSGLLGFGSTNVTADAVAGPKIIPGDPGTPGVGTFSYTASTSCDSINLTGGGKDFQGVLWSNGGITASGGDSTATMVQVAKMPPTCTFPGQLDPPGPTAATPRINGDDPPGSPRTTWVVTNPNPTTITVLNGSGFAAGQKIWIDADTNLETRTIATAVGTTLTLTTALSNTHAQYAVVTNTDWPVTLPNVPASCASSSPTIDAAWLAANAPGVYCFTGKIKLDADFTCPPSPTVACGYTFVSRDSTDAAAVGATNPHTFTAYTPAGGDPKNGTLAYAVLGGFKATPGAGVKIIGRVYAPNATIEFTGGSNQQEGYMQSQKFKMSNGGTVFIGSGPGVGGTAPKPDTEFCCGLDE